MFALDELMEDTGERLPVIVSGTVTDASGRILSGQTVGAFWHSVRHARPLAVGLNCALGAALMRPYIEELAKVAGDTFISCYPNAGLPNPMSETGFDETPEVTGALMEEFAQSRLPQHRRRLLRHHARAHRADRRARRPLPAALPARRDVQRAGQRPELLRGLTRSRAHTGAAPAITMRLPPKERCDSLRTAFPPGCQAWAGFSSTALTRPVAAVSSAALR